MRTSLFTLASDSRAPWIFLTRREGWRSRPLRLVYLLDIIRGNTKVVLTPATAGSA